MTVFPRTLLQGAHDRLVDAGRMLPFATDDLATEVFDKIASDLGIPQILQQPLNRDEALLIGNTLIDYSQKLASAGRGPTKEVLSLAKTASTHDPSSRAMIVAEHYLQKAADENSLRPDSPPGLGAAAMHDLIARTDVENRMPGSYAVPQGVSHFAMPGVVGREIPAPGAPSTGANVKVAEGSQPFSEAYPRLHQFGVGLTSDPRANWNIANAAQAASAQPQQLADTYARTRGITDPAQLPDSVKRLHEEAAHARSLRNIRGGALGAQALGGAATLGGLALGARALYRHFNPAQPQEELPKAASVKQALDMPDFGAAWDSIKGTARYYRDRAGEGMGARAQQVGNFFSENAQGLDERLSDARNAQRWVGSSAETLQGLGHSEESMRALRNQNLREALGHGARLAAPVAGAAALTGLAYGGKRLYDHYQGQGARLAAPVAGAAALTGLAYGGKRLYDHYQGQGQGSPEDMEVNASDAAIEALAQSLKDHGIEPTPELLTDLHAAMEAEDAEGAGGAPSPEGASEPPKQAAEGSLRPTPKGNNLAGAAAHDLIAKTDKENRAPGAFKTPQGQTALATSPGEVGAEKKAELAWRENLVKTAQDWGPHLPAHWSEQMKHAAIQEIAALPPSARRAHVVGLLSR